MKLFKCPSCGQVLYFENTRCENCGRRLGYSPADDVLAALEPTEGQEQDGVWRAAAGAGETFRFCANAEHDACNWLIPSDRADTYCTACRHNRWIPDLSQEGAEIAWRKIEVAKHRLFYSLLRLGLPMPKAGEAAEPLMFEFLADDTDGNGPKVMTGHDDGVITIALSEADDAEREKRRAQMGEPYRTLLGHFRHEVGHYYWDVMVRDGGKLDECRRVFGDDREDYQAALKRHYEEGVPANWQERFISAYATTHAWEDFAETWAHYLHIVDTLEMARAFGMSVEPRVDRLGDLSTSAEVQPYRDGDLRPIVETWIPLAFALNSINRSMGQPDLYPFILSQAVIDKLDFIHRLVHRRL